MIFVMGNKVLLFPWANMQIANRKSQILPEGGKHLYPNHPVKRAQESNSIFLHEEERHEIVG